MVAEKVLSCRTVFLLSLVRKSGGHLIVINPPRMVMKLRLSGPPGEEIYVNEHGAVKSPFSLGQTWKPDHSARAGCVLRWDGVAAAMVFLRFHASERSFRLVTSMGILIGRLSRAVLMMVAMRLNQFS